MTRVISVCFMLTIAATTSAQTPTPINCGETRSGVIFNPAQELSYSFTADRDEAVIFSVVAISGTLQAVARLYGPADGSGKGPFLVATSPNGQSLSKRLTASGRYTLSVRDLGLNKIGAFNLSLQFTTGRCGTPIACGQTLAGSLPEAGNQSGMAHAQLAAFVFYADAGEAVIFAARGTSGPLVASAALYDPTGSFLMSNAPNSSSLSRVLPTPGFYTLIIRGFTQNQRGTFNLSLQFTTGRCGTPIACGQTLVGSLPDAGNQSGMAHAQLTAFVFYADAGEAVIFAARGTSGPLVASAALYDPTGSFLMSNAPNSSSLSRVLPSSGFYTLIIREFTQTQGGTFSVNLQCRIRPCNSFPTVHINPNPASWSSDVSFGSKGRFTFIRAVTGVPTGGVVLDGSVSPSDTSLIFQVTLDVDSTPIWGSPGSWVGAVFDPPRTALISGGGWIPGTEPDSLINVGGGVGGGTGTSVAYLILAETLEPGRTSDLFFFSLPSASVSEGLTIGYRIVEFGNAITVATAQVVADPVCEPVARYEDFRARRGSRNFQRNRSMWRASGRLTGSSDSKRNNPAIPTNILGSRARVLIISSGKGPYGQRL